MRLQGQTQGRYDQCLFFHGPGDGPKDMIASVIDVVDDILAGKDDALPFSAVGRNDLRLAKALDFARFCRIDGGSGNVVYDPALK
jgi:hypothetical protein